MDALVKEALPTFLVVAMHCLVCFMATRPEQVYEDSSSCCTNFENFHDATL